MPKTIWPLLGQQCQKCGRSTEINYIIPIVYHPGGLLTRRRFLQKWCIECVGKAKVGEISPQSRDSSVGRTVDL